MSKIDPLFWDNDIANVMSDDASYADGENPVFEIYYREGVTESNFNLTLAEDRVEWEAYQAWKKMKKLP